MKRILEEPPAPPTRKAEQVAVAEQSYQPPYLAAALAGLGVWALYALTLAPTTAFWDTSEYIATGHILGVPHPPGNPLFVLLARGWDVVLAPFGLPVAVRINLFSATMGAGAHAFWFLLAHRILAFFEGDRTFRLVGAAAAVIVSATAFTVWNQSNVNEKVYTVTLFTIALLSWLAFHWRDNLGRGKDDNLILLMVFILALSVGNHLMAFLAAPALVIFILWIEPRTLANWRLYAFGLLAVIIGLSVHMYLPLRAGLDPVINEADPTCASVGEALKSVMSMGKAGCEELSAALSRQQYDKPSMLSDPNNPELPRTISLLVAQVANYLQYFNWQWARSVAGNDSIWGGMRPVFTLSFILLGLFGAWSHFLRDRKSWTYVAVLFLTLSAGLVFYLNFRYGYSLFLDAQPNRDLHEVRERDYFFIVSFSLWGLWAGIGIAALWQRLGEQLSFSLRRPAPTLAAPFLAIALVPMALNWSWASRANDYSARDWAYNLLMSVEPYSVLFTNGDNDTFPLWYLQEVEGIRRDVSVIVMSYLNTPWYVKQLRELTSPCQPGEDPNTDPTRIICQRPYLPQQGPAFYREAARRIPTKSILPLEDAQIDQIAGTPPFLTQVAQTFPVGKIQTTIPASTVMIPADIFMAFIINTSIEDRPIYYATTTNAFDELKLGDYLIRQGVAFKLNNGPVQEDEERGLIRMPPEIAPVTGPFLDLPRTETLLWNVFVHRGGIPDRWGRWVDAATQGIPYYYAYTHYAAANAHALRSDSAQAQKHMERMEAWSLLGQK